MLSHGPEVQPWSVCQENLGGAEFVSSWGGESILEQAEVAVV